jgi:hypothetical protein
MQNLWLKTPALTPIRLKNLIFHVWNRSLGITLKLLNQVKTTLNHKYRSEYNLRRLWTWFRVHMDAMSVLLFTYVGHVCKKKLSGGLDDFLGYLAYRNYVCSRLFFNWLDDCNVRTMWHEWLVKLLCFTLLFKNAADFISIIHCFNYSKLKWTHDLFPYIERFFLICAQLTWKGVPTFMCTQNRAEKVVVFLMICRA